jgi:hypothetical protein
METVREEKEKGLGERVREGNDGYDQSMLYASMKMSQ